MPEPSGETPAEACTTDDLFEKEEQPPGKRLDKLSSSTSTATPGTSLVKYGAPVPRSLSVGSPVLAMCCGQDLTITTMTPEVSPGIGTSLISHPRDPHSPPDSSPSLPGSHTTCRLSSNAAPRLPLISWSLLPLDGGSSPSPPSTTPPSSRRCRLTSEIVETSLSMTTRQPLSDSRLPAPDSLVAVAKALQSRIRDGSDSTGTSGTYPLQNNGLDVTLSPVVPYSLGTNTDLLIR